MRKNELCPLDLFLIICIKFHLKWLTGLNIKAETIEALEENRAKSYQLWDRRVFLRTQKALTTKEKN